MPPLPRKEIRQRAQAFVKEWRGVTRRRLASFEEPVKKSGGGQGFVDLLWKGKLLIEHKSAGKDMDKAYLADSHALCAEIRGGALAPRM